jgi:hypothetical protein
MSAQHNTMHLSPKTRLQERIKPLKRQTKRLVKMRYRKLTTKYMWIAKLVYKFKRHFGRLPEPLPFGQPFDGEDTRYEDGWFHCTKCKTETYLYYRVGKYPLGIMRCSNVYCKSWARDCVINAESNTSELLRRVVHPNQDIVPVPRYPAILKDQVPYFTVCNRCGLSQRAKKVDAASLTVKERQIYGLSEDDVSQSALVSFEHIERCPKCNKLRDDGNASTQWLRFSIHYADGYHFLHENFDSFYGIVPRE